MKIHTQRIFVTPLFLLLALAACADKDGGQGAMSTAQNSAVNNPGAMPLPKAEEALLSPEHIMKHIYLGQAYPSGNVYLRPFQESENTAVSWPEKVTYRLSRVIIPMLVHSIQHPSLML